MLDIVHWFVAVSRITISLHSVPVHFFSNENIFHPVQIMESSKYISLLTEKEIQKIFDGLDKNIDIRKTKNKKNISRKKVRNNIEEKSEAERGFLSKRKGKKCKLKPRYLELVIDKLVNRKSCSYFKECHFKI